MKQETSRTRRRLSTFLQEYQRVHAANRLSRERAETEQAAVQHRKALKIFVVLDYALFALGFVMGLPALGLVAIRVRIGRHEPRSPIGRQFVSVISGITFFVEGLLSIPSGLVWLARDRLPLYRRAQIMMWIIIVVGWAVLIAQFGWPSTWKPGP